LTTGNEEYGDPKFRPTKYKFQISPFQCVPACFLINLEYMLSRGILNKLPPLKYVRRLLGIDRRLGGVPLVDDGGRLNIHINFNRTIKTLYTNNKIDVRLEVLPIYGSFERVRRELIVSLKNLQKGKEAFPMLFLPAPYVWENITGYPKYLKEKMLRKYKEIKFEYSIELIRQGKVDPSDLSIFHAVLLFSVKLSSKITSRISPQYVIYDPFLKRTVKFNEIDLYNRWHIPQPESYTLPIVRYPFLALKFKICKEEVRIRKKNKNAKLIGELWEGKKV